jgi:hypothetical protein
MMGGITFAWWRTRQGEEIVIQEETRQTLAESFNFTANSQRHDFVYIVTTKMGSACYRLGSASIQRGSI